MEKGKPDPEIYLLAAKDLEVSPSECLVVKDPPSGVQAALNAGMKAVAVSTGSGNALPGFGTLTFQECLWIQPSRELVLFLVK